MTTRRRLLCFFAAAPAAVSTLAPPAARGQPQRLRVTVAAGHPPVFLWVKLLDEFFIPEVDRRLKEAGLSLAIEWNRAYGGTLAKLGSELDTMRDGISDAGFVSTVFEAAKMPLQNVSYDCPFGVEDVFLLAAIVERLQDSIRGMGEAWTRHGLVYLGGAALDTYPSGPGSRSGVSPTSRASRSRPRGLRPTGSRRPVRSPSPVPSRPITTTSRPACRTVR